MLLPQMLSHFIRASIALPVTLRASDDGAQMSLAVSAMDTCFVADTLEVALKSPCAR